MGFGKVASAEPEVFVHRSLSSVWRVAQGDGGRRGRERSQLPESRAKSQNVSTSFQNQVTEQQAKIWVSDGPGETPKKPNLPAPWF